MTFNQLLKIAAAICFGLAVVPIITLNVALVPLGLLFWVVSELITA